MAKSTKQQAATVHAFATSRIEKASQELKQLRADIKKLETKKAALGKRILGMVRQDGTADEEGKIRYASDTFTFQIIEGVHVYIDETKMTTAMSAEGLTPEQIKKVKRACVTRKTYEYVGVYNKQVEVASQEQAS